MALIVEDSTGTNPNAEVYLSVADAEVYFLARRYPDAWRTAGLDDKESALRYATRFLDGKFRWEGSVLTTDQPLKWPREGYDDEGRLFSGVPTAVKEAVCELALAHLSDTLVETFERGGKIAEVHAGSVGVRYEGGATPGRDFAYIRRLLRGLAISSSSASISRA